MNLLILQKQNNNIFQFALYVIRIYTYVGNAPTEECLYKIVLQLHIN